MRFFRWASNRLGKQGVLAFITNRSYLDKRSFDGFRKIIAGEFQEIWLVDLLGDLRSKDRTSVNQGGNIFAIQTGVAIGFFIRNPKLDACQIHYLHTPAGTTGLEKLRWLQSQSLRILTLSGEFRSITLSERNEWLNQPYENWEKFLPVASKSVKSGGKEEAIFKLYSLGINTSRDEWLYSMSTKEVVSKVRYFLTHYDALRTKQTINDGGIKWSETLKRHLQRQRKEKPD